jgi:hypothetical protein
MAPDRLARAAVLLYGAYHLVVGLALAVAPHLFFRTIGPFGAYNRHYAGDNATFELALGGGLLAAASRPSWRLPLLVVTAAQGVLHAVNHLIDIDDAHPAWVGVFDAVTLLVLAAVAMWVVAVARRAERIAAGGPSRERFRSAP